MPDTQPDCRCYVRRLTEEARFGLRYGAHSLTCPTYHPSRDPVDRQADEDFRADAEIAGPRVINALIDLRGTPLRFDMGDDALGGGR